VSQLRDALYLKTSSIVDNFLTPMKTSLLLTSVSAAFLALTSTRAASALLDVNYRALVSRGNLDYNASENYVAK